MTDGVCSICGGTVGVHDAAKHKAWAGARSGTRLISRAEVARLIRENAHLRAEVARLKEATP